jgi:hypothetical protein
MLQQIGTVRGCCHQWIRLSLNYLVTELRVPWSELAISRHPVLSWFRVPPVLLNRPILFSHPFHKLLLQLLFAG